MVPLYTDLSLYNSFCHQRLSCRFLLLENTWRTSRKAALATCQDIFPPGPANTGGSHRATRSPKCSPSCPNLNLGASRKSRDHVALLSCGRMSRCVRGLTFLALLTLDLLVQVSCDYKFVIMKFLNIHFSCHPAVTLSCSFSGPIFSSLPFLSLLLS